PGQPGKQVAREKQQRHQHDGDTDNNTQQPAAQFKQMCDQWLFLVFGHRLVHAQLDFPCTASACAPSSCAGACSSAASVAAALSAGSPAVAAGAAVSESPAMSRMYRSTYSSTSPKPSTLVFSPPF